MVKIFVGDYEYSAAINHKEYPVHIVVGVFHVILGTIPVYLGIIVKICVIGIVDILFVVILRCSLPGAAK